ncbi:MAG: hypothetical protein JSV88_16885 [Candidatus Aminicenantes bacterium]|nr:MAG: hypothetical protein JSV88_16885 [Candidatus Aminicenantes bacterium]
MRRYINKGIKEVLKEYPQLAPILAEYDINCYKCDGNCLFKDIFEEHNLSMKEEMELKRKMAKIMVS